MDILVSLLKILASPGGDAMLTNIFASHNMSPASVQKIVDDLKDAPPLAPLTDTTNTPKF
jgi:predicted transcriptional regulator